MPVTVLGLFATLHSLAYGLGYLLGFSGFPSTILYNEIQHLMPHAMWGLIVTIVSMAAIWALLRHNPRWVRYTSWAQAFIWFFVFLVYVFAGAWLLGVGVGLSFAFTFAYLAYIYKDLRIAAAKYLEE